MNDQTLAKGKTEWWPLLVKYLGAVANHWYAIVVGLGLVLLDFAERALGTWWVVPKWLRLTSAAIGFTAAQFLAYSDLHRARLSEKKELLREIEELSTRPYDQAQLETWSIRRSAVWMESPWT